MNLPNLHADVKCVILSTCNGVQCCVKSPELRRNYQVHFSIDYCSQSLFIQIEKVFYTKALHDLRWGIYYLSMIFQFDEIFQFEIFI